MNRPEVLAHQVANLLVAGTGLAYGWTLYLATSDDPFAVVNHPWQPALHSGHLLAAPLLVFVVGFSWHGHVWSRLRFGMRHKRRTGALLALLFVPMVASGYAIQVSVEEALRTTWVWTHVATSLLWIAAYVVHLLLPSPSEEELWEGAGEDRA